MSAVEVKKLGPHSYEITTNGCLFDLDGTLMLSTDSVEAFWRDFANAYELNEDEIVESSHGRRTLDMFELWKPEFATNDKVAEHEIKICNVWKHLAKPVPGVRPFLASLPKSQWGIVTSGTNALASSWFAEFLHIPTPEVFITAEKVKKGKPDPEGYLEGQKALCLKNFVVFEDAPAGIKAGKNAGALVIGMATTYSAEQVLEFGADIVIPDLERINLKTWDEKTQQLVLSVNALN